MELQSDRRREARYLIETKAIVRKQSGETVRATALDISGSGMRLLLEQPGTLDLGQEVTVEVELPESPDKPFSAWGVGRVAWIDGRGTGIELSAGQFDPLPSEESESCHSCDDTAGVEKPA